MKYYNTPMEPPAPPIEDASAEELYDCQKGAERYTCFNTKAFQQLVAALENPDHARLLMEFQGQEGE